MWAESAAALLNQLDPAEARAGTVRFPYAAGLLARGDMQDAVAFGRSLGLDVQVFKGSGFLVQRGYIVAKGAGQDLYKFVQRLAVTIEWSNE